MSKNPKHGYPDPGKTYVPNILCNDDMIIGFSRWIREIDPRDYIAAGYKIVDISIGADVSEFVLDGTYPIDPDNCTFVIMKQGKVDPAFVEREDAAGGFRVNRYVEIPPGKPHA